MVTIYSISKNHWNTIVDLPVILRSIQNIITFKKHLKTYLFRRAWLIKSKDQLKISQCFRMAQPLCYVFQNNPVVMHC